MLEKSQTITGTKPRWHCRWWAPGIPDALGSVLQTFNIGIHLKPPTAVPFRRMMAEET